AVEHKYRADLLRDLVTGPLADVPAAVAYARTFGWELERPVVVVVAEPDPPPGAAGPAAGFAGGGLAREAGEARPARERFAAAWHTVVRSRDPRAPVASFNDEVVPLLGVPAD